MTAQAARWRNPSARCCCTSSPGARRGDPGVRGADRRAAAHPRCAVRDQPARPHQAPDRGRGTLVPAGLPRLGPRHRHVHDRVPGATREQSSPPTGRRVPAATASCGPAPICPPWPPSPIPAYPPGLGERIVTHMIEETARHAGHADILREQIDGSPACETIRRWQRGGTRPLTASHTAVSAFRHVTNRIRLMHGVRSEHFPRRRWQSRSSRL